MEKMFQSKYANLVLFFIFLVIPLLLYLQYFLNDLTIVTGDGVQYFSMRKALSDGLINDGELPLWTKYLVAGIPYLSYGDFSPIGFLLSFLPMKYFMYSYYSLHLAMGAFFMFLYLKELGCNKKAAFVVALLYETSVHLGGFRKSHMMIIAVVVFLPVILYFIQKYLNTKNIKWLLFSSIAMAIQFYSGHTQYVLYTDIILFFYLLCYGIHLKMPWRLMIKHGITWVTCYIGLIALQLIPVIEVMNEYGKNSIDANNFDVFSSWSIHFIKIIMMLFPYIFGNDVWMSFGNKYSSEMDIELFIGTFLLLFLVFSIVYLRRNFMVKLFVCLAIGVFTYAAIGHIPVIRDIVFHLPILGGFRCPSRALFIFIFFSFVLASIALTAIFDLKKRHDFEVLLNMIMKYVILLFSIVGFSMIVFLIGGNLGYESIKQYYVYCKLVFLDIMFILFIIYFLIKLLIYLEQKKFISVRTSYNIILSAVLIITLLQILPFTLYTSSAKLDLFSNQSIISEKLKSEIVNYKIWDAFPSIDGGHESIISQNKSVPKQIASINAYITYNNPRMYKLFSQNETIPLNFSGAMTGSLYAEQNLLFKNDLLSMLGVKYIIDSYHLIPEDGHIVTLQNRDVNILEKNFFIPANNNLSVTNKPISLNSKTWYKISYIAKSEKRPQLFYIDFYGNNYDLNSAQANLLADGKEHIIYLYSGEIPVETSGTDIRFVSQNLTDIQISNLLIEECTEEKIPNIYKLYDFDGDVPIYENTLARDVLYYPDNLISNVSSEEIYENPLIYDLSTNAYIEEKIFLGEINRDATIKNINFTNNKITAKVNSTSDAFLVFSQCYYPGWKAYVDNKETKIYMVNGVIQGIRIPAGEHSIMFKYDPLSVKIGALITFVTLVGIIIYIRKEKIVHNIQNKGKER